MKLSLQVVLKVSLVTKFLFFVKVIGLIDIKLEVGRINKRVKQLEDLRLKLNQKMTIPGYETKVPENVRAENTEKLAGYDNEL